MPRSAMHILLIILLTFCSCVACKKNIHSTESAQFKYSERKLNSYLDKGYKVLVLVKSKYSTYSESYIDKYATSNNFVVLVHEWDWDKIKQQDENIFSKHGFTKEAYALLFDPTKDSEEYLPLSGVGGEK